MSDELTRAEPEAVTGSGGEGPPRVNRADLVDSATETHAGSAGSSGIFGSAIGRAILNPDDGIGLDLLNTAPSRTNRPSTAETGVDEEELIDAGGLPEAVPDAAHMMMMQFLGGLATEQQEVD